MAGLDAELRAALRAMESSFQVRLIGMFAQDLIWAPADAKAAPWLEQNHPHFDQFPVKQGNATVGILARHGDHDGKTVHQAMAPLSERVIVSADMPIADLIPQMSESHFRLILRGGCMDGLVTQSDLLKLPVRILLFGLISHLELCLRALVREAAPWPEWVESLESKRRKEVRSKMVVLKKSHLEPDPLEFTYFSDVLAVVKKKGLLGDGFEHQASEILILRNDTAHAKTFINSADDVRQFAGRFTNLRDLIDRVSRMLKAPQ
jgi:hypothetical protein